MLAHRVGTLGAIVAVLILSVELVGAIAYKHHAVQVARTTLQLTSNGQFAGDLDDLTAQIESAVHAVVLARSPNERAEAHRLLVQLQREQATARQVATDRRRALRLAR